MTFGATLPPNFRPRMIFQDGGGREERGGGDQLRAHVALTVVRESQNGDFARVRQQQTKWLILTFKMRDIRRVTCDNNLLISA